jgi:hypothetical protein
MDGASAVAARPPRSELDRDASLRVDSRAIGGFPAMKRTVTAIGATLGAILMLTASSAHAQQYAGEYSRELGQKGQFIISADRLVPFFAFTHDSTNFTDNNVKTTDSTSQSSMSFFYGYTAAAANSAAAQGALLGDFYTVPRVGFDYTIIPNLTIGGVIALYFTFGGNNSHKVEGDNMSNTTTVGSPSTTIFGIAPRVGYIFRLTNLFSVWPRGGFSFYTGDLHSSSTNDIGGATVTDTTKINAHVFSLDLDPQFVLTPAPNFGFTAGITFDIPLGGGNTVENDTVATTNGAMNTTINKTSGGASALYLGVTLGMLVHF